MRAPEFLMNFSQPSGGGSINPAERKSVYTFIFGNYDDLKSPAIVTPDWDYLCFTDDPTLRSDIWQIRLSPRGFWDRRLENNKYARKLKILFHRYLSEYDVSLSIDASLQVNCDLNDFVRNNFSEGDDILICHQPRGCLYGDADLSMHRLLDDPERIQAQVKRYAAAGYPKQNGLYMGGIIGRRHDRPAVRAMCNLWWKEYRNGSSRDQLSLNYAIWRTPQLKISRLDYREQYFETQNFIAHTHRRNVDFGSARIEFQSNSAPTEVIQRCADKDYVGSVDAANRDRIFGWAADRNRLNTSINVSLYDGDRLVAIVPANLMRPDVGAYLGDNGLHGFAIPVPVTFMNGTDHTISVRFETNDIRIYVVT